MKMQRLVLAAAVLVAGLGLSVPAHAQQMVLRASVVSAGADAAAGAGYRLTGTAGVADAGTVADEVHVLRGGFWAVAHPPAVPLVVPVAVHDTVATDEDTPLVLRPLANDTDPGGGALAITSVTQPDSGTVVLDGDTLLTYGPPSDFNGQEQFTYTATNAQGGSATAVVTVTVRPVNDAPAFASQPVTDAAAGEAYVYTAVAADVDGDAVAITAAALPAWLAFTDNVDGTASLTGTPTHDEVGGHEVVLRADDGTTRTEQAFVVTVSEAAPPAPLLVAPGDGALGLVAPLTLRWQAAAGASSYDVQVATAEDFSTLVHDTTGVVGDTLQLTELADLTAYFWRVRAVNGAGASDFAAPFRFSTATPVAVQDEVVPAEYALRPNYPNPFNPATTVTVDLPAPAHVRLIVYDISGRVVATLVDEPLHAGRHAVVFEAGGLASGPYLCRLVADEFTATRVMVLAQ